MSDTFDFQRCLPEDRGISSSSILEFMEAFENVAAGRNDMEMHSIMLVRHGCVVAEGWWAPNKSNYRHMLYSLSKSFTSTAVGFAVTEGLMTVDDRVVSFFPEDLPAEVSENLAAMRVRDLLTMSTGHAVDTFEVISRNPKGDWVKLFLNEPVVYTPGTHFLYNTGATYMLSAIVQKVTGSRMIDYLKPRLFEPLGIENPIWEVCSRGINTGGFGLSVRTEDIARFGQLYLQKGQWNGRQILPRAWIEEATDLQISNGSGLESDGDWGMGYGYQFWRCRNGAYRGDGAFGQYCIVMPEQDAVLAITSGVSDMGLVLDLIWKHLLPGIKKERLTDDKAAQAALQEKLKNLHFSVPEARPNKTVAEFVNGKRYVFDRNIIGFDGISFEFAGDTCIESIYKDDKEYKLCCGLGEWIEGDVKKAGLDSPFYHTSMIFTAGTWTEDNTFKMIIRFIETPHYNIITHTFGEDELRISIGINVGMSSEETKPIVGRLVK